MKTIICCTVAATLFAAASSALAAPADVSTTPSVFPDSGQYTSGPITYNTGGGPVVLNSLDIYDMKPSGITSLPVNVGDDFPAKSFFDVFVDITLPPVGAVVGTGSADTIVQRETGSGNTGTFDTQMTQLDITGLPGGAMIRIDPSSPSTGQTTITPNGGGNYNISSFFDIFTDLSLDGGNTWVPSTGPTVVTLKAPDNGATLPMLLLPVALLAFGAYRQKNCA